MERCSWCGDDPLYVKYHDEEWGVPAHDDRRHFEFLVLEAAQAGLSWITILRKRANYRRAYDGFDPARVSRYDAGKIEALLKDGGIIRNRRKIEASVNNARRFLEIREEFGSFDEYIWRFVDHRPVINSWQSESEIPASTPLSGRISLDLKKRGFQFLGPTIVYAYMQAVGLVNDHVTGCFRHGELLYQTENHTKRPGRKQE
ncbi:MAG: DNA-3-methyladenine glycosylase I [Deltaproteobacteria bacterium]|nr:DNA-3-methyladenine glycosylase I [Deltaproteobacteria bacterium]